MNTDFRLSIGLFTHPKYIKLERRLGTAGALALIRLFAFVSQNRPDGILSKMDNDDIAIAANYNDDGTKLVEALVAVGFIDVNQATGERSIHDWIDHNPWAAGAVARSEKARNAAQKRWGNGDPASSDQPKGDDKPKPPARPSNPPRKDKQSDKQGDAMLTDASSMPVASSSNAPNQNQYHNHIHNQNLPSPSGGVGGEDHDSENGDEDPGRREGGDLPIGKGEDAPLPLPSSAEAADLVPEDLLARFKASVYAAKWEKHLASVLAQAKGTVRRPAMYLKPVILRILAGTEPLPGEKQAQASEVSAEREKAAQNRIVTAEKARLTIPDDWLPGVDETQVCEIAYKAYRRAKLVLGKDIDPLCDQVRNEARVIYRQLHPEGTPMPWDTQETEPGAVGTAPLPEPETVDIAQVREVIQASLPADERTEDYSLQNTPTILQDIDADEFPDPFREEDPDEDSGLESEE